MTVPFRDDLKFNNILLRHLKLAYIVDFGKATRIRHFLIDDLSRIIHEQNTIETIVIQFMSLEEATVSKAML